MNYVEFMFTTVSVGVIFWTCSVVVRNIHEAAYLKVKAKSENFELLKLKEQYGDLKLGEIDEIAKVVSKQAIKKAVQPVKEPSKINPDAQERPKIPLPPEQRVETEVQKNA